MSSLRTRLIALVLIASAPAFATILYLAGEQREQAGEMARARALGVARTIAAEHESRIEHGRQLLIALGEIPTVRAAANPACSDLLAGVKRASPPYYANLLAVWPNGDLACSALPVPDGVSAASMNIAKLPGFSRASHDGKFAVGEYLLGPIVRRPVLGIVSPVLDAQARTRIVTVASLDLSWLNQYAHDAQLPESATVTAVDAAGRVILHSVDPASWVGKKADELPLVRAMRSQPAGSTIETLGLDGVPRLYGHVALGPADAPYGYVAVGIPTAVAYAESERLRTRGFIGLGVAILLVIAAGWYGADRFVLRRLRPVIRTVQRVAEGDLAARTGTPPRHDELGLLGTAVDAMASALDREQAEARAEREEREAARALFDTFFDTAPIGMALLDAELRYVRVNERLATMNGLPAAAHLGRHVQEVVPEVGRNLATVFRTVLETGQPIIDQEATGDTVGAPGVERYWLLSFYPVRGAAGRVQGIGAVVQDITARKQVEQSLREAEARARAIADSSPIGIFMTGLDGHAVYVNRVTREMLGMTPEQTEYERWGEQVHADDRQRVLGAWSEFIAGRRPEYDIEHRFLTASRGERSVHVQATAIRVGEKLLGYVGTIQDITGHRQTEAELRAHREQLEELVAARTAALTAANEELEAFSYSVSHDLRAPLRAVNGFAEMLVEEYGDQFDAKAKHYISRIHDGSKRMGELIEDLLKLARVTRLEMHLRRVDLGELAREIDTELRGRHPGREVTFVLAPIAEATVDRGLLRVALANLLDNAWKYTSTGPTARIELGVEARGKERVFFVRDDGVGFDMRYAGRLFGAFQRLHASTEFPGSGIGLATVARIVRRHGGRVWAEGELGRGATFYFTLPG